MTEQVDVVVVGSGPNALAAALVMARAGLSVEVYEAQPTIGGGARTAELTLPGFHHDVCSAVHPMGIGSPFFRAFDLASHGVTMLHPEVAYASPLDGGRAALAYQDVERTAAGLGVDGPAWLSLMGPLARRWQTVVDTLMSDLRHVPQDLPTVARLGLRILEQGSPAWNLRFTEDRAPTLLTGVSAHAIMPPRGLAPAGAGLLLASLAHGVGWPIPRGGSQVIVDSMADAVRAAGGRIVAGHEVTSLAELPRARAVLMDVAPAGLLRIAGDLLPATYRRWLQAFRYGNAACKVDFALSGPVPWAAPELAAAGTLHVGGDRAEIQRTETEVAAGRHPELPYVLVSQPGVVDPSRAPEGKHTLWTYTHVPSGSTRDMGDAVTAQIERFAPGFRDLVLHRNVIPAAEAQHHNANYVGGDIAAGATTPWQMVARPVPRWDVYRTPLTGVYLASSSVPPGPGVTGMCGLHAAKRALRQRFSITTDPLELVAG